MVVAAIVKHGMAVAERAAFGILAGETNRRAVVEQRRERERLRRAPVDDALLCDASLAALELREQLAVEREAVGNASTSASFQASELRAIDRRQRRAVERIAAGDLATVRYASRARP